MSSSTHLSKYVTNEKLKSPLLSAKASPFLPQMTTECISVTSLVSPSLPCMVPVTSPQLPLSTLHQYFPLATGLHYISGQQLVTLTRSSKHNITEGKVELSNQAFCIPVLGTEFNYVVTEDGDLDCPDGDLVMSEIVSCVRNIQTEMRTSLTEVQRMEEMIKQVLEVNIRGGIKVAGKSEASLIFEVDQAGSAGCVDNEQVFENGEDERQYDLNLGKKTSVVKEVAENYFESESTQLKVKDKLKPRKRRSRGGKGRNKDKESSPREALDKKDPSVSGSKETTPEKDCKIGRNSSAGVKNENQNFVDDYGFSDTEDDISDDVFNDHTSREALSPHDDEGMKSLKDLIDEKVSDHKVGSPKKTMFSEHSYTPMTLKEEDKPSLSSRPRCVRRISTRSSSFGSQV